MFSLFSFSVRSCAQICAFLAFLSGFVQAQSLDSDSDGMPDAWEQAFALNPADALDAGFDGDFDGLINLVEYQKATHPQLEDSDYDFVADGSDLYPADRTRAFDTDSDGMHDAFETVNNLNPYYPPDANIDFDVDGLSNLQEYQAGSDLYNADSDGDSVPDGVDAFSNNAAYQQDGDQDGLPDKYELEKFFLSVTYAADAAEDFDFDGLTNIEEFLAGTDPEQVDFDNDGSPDGDDPAPTRPQYVFDSDQDGMPDEWEYENSGDPYFHDAWLDWDYDGLLNRQEYLVGTSAFNSDTDGDGFLDGMDHYPDDVRYSIDGDRDGMPAEYEFGNGLNDNLAEDGGDDFDGDLLNNSMEFEHGTSISLPDSDFDGVLDGEDLYPIDRTKALDSDKDGLPDAWEIINGLSPYDAYDAMSDSDYDGLSAVEEYQPGTDIENPDSDNDGVYDGDDRYPLNAAYQQDSDEDGLPDSYELNLFMDPYYYHDAFYDFDGDGLLNLREFQLGTHPEQFDSDGDGSPDGDDPAPANPEYVFDSDGDGMPDEWEYQNGTDAYYNDAAQHNDSDYLTNLQEYLAGTSASISDTDDDGYLDGMDHYPFDARYSLDGDRDGMPAEFESGNGLSDNDTHDGGADSDGDFLNNSKEFARGTLIFLPDSDFDGVHDGEDIDPLDRSKALDSDNDGMHDVWEILNNLDPYNPADAVYGSDSDSQSNLQEYFLGTAPNSADTDDDGVLDDADAFPLDAAYQNDSDEDGLPDSYELNWSMDPYHHQDALYDFDGDGLSNLQEFGAGTDPQWHDSDNDGSPDGDDPAPTDSQYAFDSDKDGMPDAWEYQNFTDPYRNDIDEDIDGDFLGNLQEFLSGTLGNNPDSDGDGVLDRQDHFPAHSQYTVDSDRDGVPWEWEMQYGLNDNDVYDATLDYDNDGLNNLQEYLNGGDPWSEGTADTDNDGIPDAFELQYGFNINNPDDATMDADADGLTNLDEYLQGANPVNPDTDSDGMHDGFEVMYGFNAVADNGEAAQDIDSDGLSNLDEFIGGTDPGNPDTDDDSVADAQDEFPLDPNESIDSDGDGAGNNADVDDDNDGLSDAIESSFGTDPLLADTDGDGFDDEQEVNEFGTNPLVADINTDGDELPDEIDNDDDNDGLQDVTEIALGSDPLTRDTDGDGVFDSGDTALLDPEFPVTHRYLGADDFENMGNTVAAIGDTNGDGVSDLAFGVWGYNQIASFYGAVQIVSGVDGSILLTLTEPAATFSRFGEVVAAAGDLNQDGYADVIVGVPSRDANGTDSGSMFVLSGIDGALLLTIEGESAGRKLGGTVAGVGDVDGDSIVDFAVGLLSEPSGSMRSQMARVYSGADASIIHEIAIVGSLTTFPKSPAIAALGDINNDNHGDYAVSERLTSRGRVKVYSGIDAVVLYDFADDINNTNFGDSIANAGDVNNDGINDLVVGASDDDIAISGGGAVFVYSGVDGSTLHTFYNDAYFERFGSSVATAGDVNNDGYDDLIVTARGYWAYQVGQVTAPRFSVISGKEGRILATLSQDYTAASTQVAVGIGDISGDGLGEILVGTPYNDTNGLQNNGSVHIYSFEGDSDNDGLPYMWEVDHGFDPFDAGDAGQDTDGDGLSNFQEYQLGTDCDNADTDGDGSPDAIDPFPLNPAE